MADEPVSRFRGRNQHRTARRKASPLSEFNDRLAKDGWLSPDTYANDFAEAGDFPAVYMFVVIDMSDIADLYKFHVAYVGMSTRLANRWANHPTLHKIKKGGLHVKRLFKPTPKEHLRSEERRYIQTFTPPWNIIGRVPGA